MTAALVLCTGAAPVANAQGVKLVGSSVTDEFELPSSSFGDVRARCPGTAVALEGAAVPPPAGVLRVASLPGQRSWRFRFQNTSVFPQKVRTVVRCLDLDAPRNVVKRWSFTIDSIKFRADRPEDRRETIGVRCPPGRVPTGGGYDLAPFGGAPDRVRVYEDTPTPRGRLFRVEELAGESHAELWIRCLSRKGRVQLQDGGRRIFPISILRRGYRARVPAGTTKLARNCTRGDFSLSAGYAFAPDAPIDLLGAHPANRRGARWIFGNRGSATQRARLWLICLDPHTSLRRR